MRHDTVAITEAGPYRGLTGTVTDIERHGRTITALVALPDGRELMFPSKYLTAVSA